MRHTQAITITAFIVLFIGSNNSEGRIITINPNGGAEFTTITAALEASAEGDRLLIQEGKYTEEIVLKNHQTLEGEGNVILSNPNGTTITTAGNNEIRNISIIGSGQHGIAGTDVESIVIESVLIESFNLQKSIARKVVPFGYDATYEAIYLNSSGTIASKIFLKKIQIMNGFGGGINISSYKSSSIQCILDNVEVRNIDASKFITFPSDFPASPGFPGLFLFSADISTLECTIENMEAKEIGNSGDGILVQTNDTSTMKLTIRRYFFDDPTDIGGPISQGLEFASGSPNSSIYAMMENSDILNAQRSSIGNFNWFGTNNGLIDLGGGELGSEGRNRFIGSPFHFDGADSLPITAKNNFWGENFESDLSIHSWQGKLSVDYEPFLEDDPRPNGFDSSVSNWDIYE